MMKRIREALRTSPRCSVTGENHDVDKTVDDHGNVLNTVCRQCGIRNPQG